MSFQPSTASTLIVTVGDHQFLVHPDVKAEIPPPDHREESYIAASLIRSDKTNFGGKELDRTIAEFSKVDDVWDEDFLSVILLDLPEGGVVSSDLQPRSIIRVTEASSKLAKGPYVIASKTGRVYAVSKLFEDRNSAFVGGVLPKSRSKAAYQWLRSTNKIAVPSRLYYGGLSTDLPLNGLRFGIKDCIDIAGLETACGSKCFLTLQKAKERHAPFVTQLLAAGAVLVGKMRLCQFCDGQDPAERFEEATPWNPRGDGFQKPSASSSGSSAGCASYPWLDFTIGTDTGGSVRHPAGVNGLYGIRPTLDSVQSSGLVCVPFMDTPGIFSRSATTFEVVCKTILKESKPSNELLASGKVRFKLLYAVQPQSAEPSNTPQFFPRKEWDIRSEAQEVFEKTVQALEHHLEVKRSEVCIWDMWKDTRPEGYSENLAEATQGLYPNLVYGLLYKDVIGPFIHRYREVNAGQTPYIEPLTRERLSYGARVTQEDIQASSSVVKNYATWVNETLLPVPQEAAKKDSVIEVPILIYPQAWGKPQYRDEVAKREAGKLFWDGFSVYSISYCSGCVDITLPIGEVKFRSKITERDEHLPVALSLLGPKGTDGLLLRLLSNLEAEGIIRPVKTGSRMYE